MPVPSTIETETIVRGLLEAAGLRDVSEDELAVFVEIYPHVRAAADSLYIPEILYEEPALLFTPAMPDRVY